MSVSVRPATDAHSRGGEGGGGAGGGDGGGGAGSGGDGGGNGGGEHPMVSYLKSLLVGASVTSQSHELPAATPVKKRHSLCLCVCHATQSGIAPHMYAHIARTRILSSSVWGLLIVVHSS